MTFDLNFSPETWPDPGPTVSQILDAKHWARGLVVVTIDGERVPKERFCDRRVSEGARVEVFFLVSGG